MTLKSLLEKKELTYLFFGGKGGVGKTICASAAAIKLAKHFPRVLIVSTDPAHSLSDCFDQDLSGGEPVKIQDVEGELFGLELSAEKGLEKFKQIGSMGMTGGITPSMNSTFPGSPTPQTNDDPLAGILDNDEDEPIPKGEPTTTSETSPFGFNIQDALGLGSDLMDGQSIPPGSDEAFAFGKLLELIESSDFDLVIFDTAPTGHTLRLLSLPDYLDSFVGKMVKMRVRFGNFFKGLKGLFGADIQKDNSIEILENLQKVITKARIELADDARTEFIPVMIPTMMALLETQRLATTLNDYGIPVEHFVINQLIPPSKDCPFCARRYEIQEKTLMTIRQYFGKYDITYIPMVPQEIRGIEQLQNLAKMLFEHTNDFAKDFS
jgi:arsenite-transporting ATPase